MSVQAVEEEAIWMGGDERAAKAIVRENDGLHNEAAVVERAEQAQRTQDHAA
jgi:hypothetical protein